MRSCGTNGSLGRLWNMDHWPSEWDGKPPGIDIRVLGGFWAGLFIPPSLRLVPVIIFTRLRSCFPLNSKLWDSGFLWSI